MPNALIADDEPHLAEDLRRRLSALWPALQIVADAGNGVGLANVRARLN